MRGSKLRYLEKWVSKGAFMGSGFDKDRLQRVVELCDRYVNDGKFSCAQVQIAHRGSVALRHTVGSADLESGASLREDPIFRI